MPKEINKEIESQILDYLNEHEKLSTTDAVELFQLSESTIRRMFTRLENQKKSCVSTAVSFWQSRIPITVMSLCAKKTKNKREPLEDTQQS